MASAWLSNGLPLDQLAFPAGALADLGGYPGGGGGGGGTGFTTTIGTIASRPAIGTTNIGDVFYSTDEDGIIRYENITGVSWTQTGPGSAVGAEAVRQKRAALTTLLASPGSFVAQKGYANDVGVGTGLELEWLAAGAWGLPDHWQCVGYQNTDVSCPTDTTEDTLFTLSPSFPSNFPWRANDAIRICLIASQNTANANSKTVKIKLGGTNIVSQNIGSTTKAAWIEQFDLEFRNALNVQVGQSSTADVFGQVSNAPSTFALDFSTGAKALLITGTKATSTDVLTLNKCSIWVRGGG